MSDLFWLILLTFQSEMKDTLIEIKNNLQGNNSRVDETENQINDLEHKQAKTTNQESKEKKRIQKNEESISSFWEKLSPGSHPDARYFTASSYATGAFQASALLLELRGSES